MKASIPENERERLAALHRYDVLDTPPEESFDRITRLASRFLETPIALISLVDEHRQWFKSRVGIDVAETHRELAFCAHAILDGQVLIVPDATEDVRFSDNGLVVGEPNIRAYAGAPLITRDELHLGTLCAIDQTAREFTPEQVQVLEDLAAMVVNELELRARSAELVRTKADLEQANSKLQRSNDALQQFAYAAAHDLRAPIRHIMEFARIVQAKPEGQADAETAECLNYIVSAGRRMNALTEALLSYAQVEFQERHLDRIDMNTVLSEVLEGLQSEIRSTNTKIKADRLPTIRGDRVRLAQLLQNLIGNALKFSAQEAPLVTIEAAQQDSDWVFSVKDNGIGIRADSLDFVFQPFRRMHSQADYEGSGLGLAICKKVVEQHRGKIWVESESGKGATFYFTLPLSTADEL